METWILPTLLGIGLAASTGLKTFVPLLMLAIAAKFHLFGVELSGPFAWLASPLALTALGVAAAAEFIGDKIPLVDHGISAFGAVARPAAGALAAAAAFTSLDPSAAALAGLIIGAPTALAFHTAQAGVRVASTGTRPAWPPCGVAGRGRPLGGRRPAGAGHPHSRSRRAGSGRVGPVGPGASGAPLVSRAA